MISLHDSKQDESMPCFNFAHWKVKSTQVTRPPWCSELFLIELEVGLSTLMPQSSQNACRDLDQPVACTNQWGAPLSLLRCLDRQISESRFNQPLSDHFQAFRGSHGLNWKVGEVAAGTYYLCRYLLSTLLWAFCFIWIRVSFRSFYFSAAMQCE